MSLVWLCLSSMEERTGCASALPLNPDQVIHGPVRTACCRTQLTRFLLPLSVSCSTMFLLHSTIFHLKLISLPSQHLPLIFIPTTFLVFSSIPSSFILFQYSFIYVSSRHSSHQFIPISLESFFHI